MKAKTYADRARQIINKYKKRLGDNFDKGDKLALEAMNQELSVLKEEQEETRIKMFEKSVLDNQDAIGFPIFFEGGDLDEPEKEPDPLVKRRLADSLFPVAKEGDSYKSRVPWLGMASQIASSLLANRKMNLPKYEYEDYIPTTLSPELVNFGREREQIMRNRDLANAMIMSRARGTGSQAGLMENLQAGLTETQRVAGDQFGQSLEREGVTNAEILNRIQQANEANRMAAAEINARNRMYASNIERENAMIEADRRDAKIRGISSAITGYMKDRMTADKYDQMLEIATPENYRIGVGKDSRLASIFGFSPRAKRFFVDTGDTAAEEGLDTSKIKKEKGGQLSTIQLFGDDEYEKIMMRVKKPKNRK